MKKVFELNFVENVLNFDKNLNPKKHDSYS